MTPAIDISKVTLKTSRLTLRPWTMDDLQDFYDYAKVDGVGQMAGWTPHKSIEESERILTDFVEGKKTFAIVYNNHAIGSIGIEKYNEQLCPELSEMKVREIGFVLSKDYWGNGFMPEAVKEVIRYCFEDLNLDALICGHFKRNLQSASVQRKCGFHYLKNHIYHTRYNTDEDAITNILWKKEYEKHYSH